MSHLAEHALPLNVHSSTYCAAAMHMDKDKVLHFGVGELHLVNSAKATSDRISLSIIVEKPRTLATAARLS